MIIPRWPSRALISPAADAVTRISRFEVAASRAVLLGCLTLVTACGEVVSYQPSAGSAGSGGGSDSSECVDYAGPCAPGNFYDAVLDDERNQLFLSRGIDGRVDILSLVDGSIAEVSTGFRAEAMTFDPVLDKVLVALPVKEHSTGWWEENQEGRLGVLDAAQPGALAIITLPLDPWQVVTNGNGYAYVSGGSGQFVSFQSVDLATGIVAVGPGDTADRINIRMHPSGDRFYGVDHTSHWPGDAYRWYVDGGNVSSASWGPYHNDYELCADLRIDPAGAAVYTRCGNVFSTSTDPELSLTWLGDIGYTWLDLTFRPAGDLAYVLVEGDSTLHVVDTTTFADVGGIPLSSPARRVFAAAGDLVVVREVDAHTEVERVPYGLNP